ncbi:nucleoprotein TPR [Tachysurus ichikawai]
MTSHSHSFQCFDAVVEKPSLTAGHNFASTNSSTCSKTHLEQLENCRCSLCSESQQAKPMTSVVSGNQPASWYQPQSPSHQHTHRRSMPPEGNPVYGAAHHHYNHHQYHTHRHRKRIVLVKNSNPSIQKTILLHRKPVHSLCVFMDDVSELMQCLIRKLYTLDGHRVDNIQSLLQGPSILVCVGHEPFHPLLLDSFQNNSEVKLPKLILKARSSTCNEDQGYKKNVNFGLKSKKSISPGHFPEARENMLDDDIEKRVLVNKDGSLSMEMKVRFRLLNDETLHCSTEIKKSSCTFNVSFPEQDNVDYPQCGHSESCSEAESLSASEAEDVYIPRLCQKHLQEPHSQHCCTHCQEYDIWKNPTLRKQETLRHFGSTNFNASSHKVKCKTESFDRMNTTSCEEYTEQVVEKATCIEHTVGERDKGDNTVQYCTISRCSSHSEVRSSKNLKQDQMSVQITKVSIEDERPLSVETNSSDILASLKEDKDKEEPDLTPYNSRASQNNKSKAKQIQNAEENSCTFTPCKPPESPNHSISMRSSSIASSCSVKSKTSGKVVVTKIQKNVNQDGNNTPSSTPHTCENKDPAIGNGTSAEKLEATNQAEDVLDENEVVEIDMRVLKSESDLSKTCGHISDDTLETFKRNEKGRSSVRSTPSNSNTDLSISNSHVVAEQESVNVGDASEEENIEVISHAMSADTDTSESPIPNNKTEGTDCSMNVIDNKSEKNSTSSCRHSSSSFSELVSSVLPKSSPTEVVNEWLKKIPIESALYDVWDDFQKNCEEEVVLKMTGEVMKYERRNGREGDADVAVPKPENEQLPLGKIENNESKVGDMKETTKENIQPCTFPDVPSCVQLMRILLSPKLERCNSLPEVSPVYARKLSMSARGFLDSLVNLHLLDFNPNDVNGKDEKYSNLMKMLQTLCDPPDSMTIPQKNAFNNQQSNDEEYNFRSSSGEDINSSSQVSEKSSDNVSTLTLKSQSNTERQGMLTNVQEIDQTEERIERISNSATPDIASRVRWTPENDVEENIQESNLLLAVQENDSNVNQKLTDHKEDTCSGSPSSGQILTEKVSQDPYPVWVLNLLNSVEKEFMTHYVNAMVEFKVRWNLNNNEQLDVMICELRDEVHKRIQVSINNELRKIQGHVGKPRPPKESMSRESSILSEQRRRRLKVNLNQSTESAARTGDDDGNTKLMTEFSDQQNDDEYCPCDTCMKKKMLLRPVFPTEVRNSAPLMTDFDLRKILNLKRNPLSNSTVNVNETENMEQHTEDGNVAEDVWLQSFMKEKTQPGFTEQKQNKSDTINYKCLGKEYSQVVVGSKPQEVRKGGSWSSPEDDVSDTQPNKLKKLQSNNTSRALEQESPSASGEHLEIASADSTAEEENAQSGPADMGGDDKITEDEEEVCNNPIERKGSMEGETVREKHSIQAGTARENLKVETGTVGEQEAADRESTDGKGTEDNETVDETAEDKTESVGERASKENQAAEGEISEPELVKKGEIPDDAKEMKENAKNESTWKESEGSDIAVEAEKIVSTNNEKTDANKSAEEDIKKISKEGGEDDLLEEEKISEPAEDGYITEHESAEGAYPMNDESENEEETDNDEIDAEVKTTKAETVADEEPADAETNKAQTDDTADDVTENEETPTAKFAEDREITNDKIADDEGADTGNKVISETPCNETVDETKFKTTEYEEMHDDRISDDGEAVVVAEDEETAETAEKNRNDDDDDDIDNDNVDDNDDDNDDDDERSEKPEIIDNEIVAIDAKDSETPNDNKADCEITEDEETPNDNATNGETAEESETPNDDKADDGTAEDEEKPNDNTVDDGTAEDSETPNDNTIDDGTAEDSETPKDNTVDDGTAEDSETPNDNTVDDGTAEDSETPNDNRAIVGKAEESDLEEVDETTGAETAEDGEQEDDGRANGQIGDDKITDDETTTGTEDEENKETAEAKTGENKETADNGTTEDRDTADASETDDEELSEHEIAHNREIVDCSQSDDSESLENGETAEEVNGETHKINTVEAVINTHNMKKANSNMLSIYVSNPRESDEGGDEAEDETEPVGETEGSAYGIKCPAMQPMKFSLHKADIKINSTVKVYPSSEDGADADAEDSDTEVYNLDGCVENEVED